MSQRFFVFQRILKAYNVLPSWNMN